MIILSSQILPPGESNPIDIEGGGTRGGAQTLAMLEEEQNVQQLEERERAVRQLEADIMDVNQIFKDLAGLVHDQVVLIPCLAAYIPTLMSLLRARWLTP